MGLKLCIEGYLNLSQQGKIVFPLETAHYRFFPCPLVLNSAIRIVVHKQQVYSTADEVLAFVTGCKISVYFVQYYCKPFDCKPNCVLCNLTLEGMGTIFNGRFPAEKNYFSLLRLIEIVPYAKFRTHRTNRE